MFLSRLVAAMVALGASAAAATLGNVVPLVGGASDLVLDEGRGRLYLVNNSANRVEVYSLSQRRFLSPVLTDSAPVAAALSRNRRVLYVTCHEGSAVDLIDLDRLVVAGRVSLPAKPEGIAVGGDDRVLITTIGTGANNATNTLLVFDPRPEAPAILSSLVVAPAPPTPPQLPPPSNRIFLAYRSRLLTTKDGHYIIGLNGSTAAARTLFVYEVASATVLRSRVVGGISNVLAVSPDGSKFMAGLNLFATESLSVVARQNSANARFTFPAGPTANFDTQTNQGGSIFSTDGKTLYSAFNIVPVQTPPARANVTRLLLSDPDNLLIRAGLQLPENLVGAMVISSDGTTIYALSESGFLVIPVGSMSQGPLLEPDLSAVLLASDQCGTSPDKLAAAVGVTNSGAGRPTVTAQLVQSAAGATVPIPGTIPPNPQAAPTVQVQSSGSGAILNFRFNPVAARSLGTVTPHEFLIQSSEAINIPSNVRVFQNSRDTESRGEIVPVLTSAALNEGLVDMVADTVRQRLYLANSGMNRVEIYDMRRRAFLDPIKVGQLPHSMALSTEASTLYVANSGGESISIIDLDKAAVIGSVRFPAIPFNSAFALVTPSVIANGLRGPQVVMSDGTLWEIQGADAVPRTLNASVFGSIRSVPAPHTMASTPGGEYVLLLAGNGSVYLYDALADEYVATRQVFTNPIQGYYGPVTAGPQGQYYVVNGAVLNQALTPIGSSPASGRPIAALTQVGSTTYARFAQPVRASQTALPSETPVVELVDTNSGVVSRSVSALEGPIFTVTGTTRVNVFARTMAVDSAAGAAYLLTTSGLSIVPLTVPNQADRPVVSAGGVVSAASFQSSIAPGGLVSIFGRNMADSAVAGSTPLPRLMGGVCVTLNNQPLPLLMTSSGQINGQIPPELTAGRYPLVVRSVARQSASAPVQVAVSKYAPAVFVGANNQALIFRLDGSPVSRNAPAKRDEPIVLYATGLGVTTGGRVTAGNPAPSSPLAVTDKVAVFFGDPRYKQSEVIVDWSGLAPGFIGLNQLNLRVPGFHMSGESLPVMLRIGGISSPTTGAAAPLVTVD